jgi:hypothetical protein
VRRFEDAFERHKQGRRTAEEMGELRCLASRHFRRRSVRYEAERVAGLRDTRLGRVSNLRARARELQRLRRLYRDEYSDFPVKFSMRNDLGATIIRWGYTVMGLALQKSGEVKAP